MAWRRVAVSLAAVIAAGLMAPAQGRAQQIVQDALAILPADAVRFEYSSPAKLRSLPKYSQLRDQYLGRELKVLETSLAQLGVREADVAEVVLSWEPAEVGMARMDGIASGHFDAQALADHARENGIKATPVGNMAAYCLGSDSGPICVMAIKSSEGAFGTLQVLKKMAAVESGQAPALGTNPQFVKLVDAVLKHVAAKQILLNPDCGFAPHHGEPPQVDEAFNKLKALADAAQLLRLRAKGKDIRKRLRDEKHGPVSHRYHLRAES